jgi:rhodanese-related sulfurtransferase
MTQLSLFGQPAPSPLRLGHVPPALLAVRPANDVHPDPRLVAECARGVVRAIAAVILAKAGEP